MTVKQDNLNKQMQSSVIAVNKHLAKKVKTMEQHELLANMHPLDAEYYLKKIFLNRSNLTSR